MVICIDMYSEFPLSPLPHPHPQIFLQLQTCNFSSVWEVSPWYARWLGIGNWWKNPLWEWWIFYTVSDWPSNYERFCRLKVKLQFSCFILHIRMYYFVLMLSFLIVAVVKKQIVNYQGDEVHRLNELEYVYDEVWANVWMVWTCSPTTSSLEQLISYYTSQLYSSNMNLWKLLGRIFSLTTKQSILRFFLKLNLYFTCSASVSTYAQVHLWGYKASSLRLNNDYFVRTQYMGSGYLYLITELGSIAAFWFSV